MRLIFVLPLALVGLLAACDNAAEAPKTVEDAARQAASLEKPKPGKYSSSVKVLEFDIPGLPPAQADQMKNMMGGLASQTHEFCLTAEEVAKGYEEMVRKSTEGNCTFEKFDASTNKLDARMSCEMDEGMKADVTLQGTMGATRSQMVMEIDQTAPGVPGGAIHTKMEVNNERIGDCS